MSDPELTLSFIISELLANQTLIFQLTVADDKGAIASDAFSIERTKEVPLIVNASSELSPSPLKVHFSVVGRTPNSVVAFLCLPIIIFMSCTY